jgi:hypothetical protein
MDMVMMIFQSQSTNRARELPRAFGACFSEELSFREFPRWPLFEE